MKILWIGSFASEKMLQRMPVKSIGQASGVTSQRSLIGGLDKCFENSDVLMDTLSAQGFPAYPIYPYKHIEREVWSRKSGTQDISVGFKNTRMGKLLTLTRSFRQEARRWVQNNQNQDILHIFLYEPVFSRLAAVETIKKMHSNVRCHLIVPDIPEFVGQTGNSIKAFAKWVRKQMVDRMLKYVDDYIFYSEGMAAYYHIPPERYIVMEGSIDDRDIDVLHVNKSDSDEVIFMYSGAITRQRAIPEFVDAFLKYPNPNVKLWFTGGGNYAEELKRIAEKDSRIIYHGFLESREDVLRLESQATALLHIRDVKALSSINCFPSKLFEYMVSEKPVLSVRIGGIPDEYYPFLIEVPSLTDEGVQIALDCIVKMSVEERRAMGERARDFIQKSKNSKVQAKKMLSFVLR